VHNANTRDSVVLAVIAAAAITPTKVAAYDNEVTHQYITGEATGVFNFPELDRHLDRIVTGPWHEDEEDEVYNYPLPMMAHFWDADDSDTALVKDLFSNAWMKAGSLLSMAYERYLADDKEKAYEFVGACVPPTGRYGCARARARRLAYYR